MTIWQRRARLIIAVAAVGFAILVATKFKARPTTSTNAPVVSHDDPKVIVQSSKGRLLRLNRDHEEIRVSYEELLAYANSTTTKLKGVTIVTERANGRTFTVTADESEVAENESDFELSGHVHVSVSDGMIVQTDRATYKGNEGLVRAPGLVSFSRGRMAGSGTGLLYDKNRDVTTILDNAVVDMQADEQGHGRIKITSGAAEVDREKKIITFTRTMHADREFETTDADSGVAYLTEDEQQVKSVELRGGVRITGSRKGAGALRGMSARDIDMKYAPGGEAIEHASLRQNASIELSGDPGQAGRRIAASTIDASMAKDGSTPTGLVAREAVELTIPAAGADPLRTISALAMDAKGEEGKGLTSANFRGNVVFREKGADRLREAHSGAVDITLAPGLSTIDDATFSGVGESSRPADKEVRFQDGTLVATASTARYLIKDGALSLKSPPSARRPHMADERITVDAASMDVILEGPHVTARGAVTSQLLPAKPRTGPSSSGSVDPKVPSMLKKDEVVTIRGNTLEYDGEASKATYTGKADLVQGEFTIKGETLVIDDKNGNLYATGGVTTTAKFRPSKSDESKDPVLSIGKGTEFRYEEAERRATYDGNASLTGPQGDMTAEQIQLYLMEAGDEVERAEGHRRVRVKDKSYTINGNEMKYFSADERYELTGTPMTIVDKCGATTTALTLTYFRATDKIIVDGNDRARTLTTGKGSSCQ